MISVIPPSITRPTPTIDLALGEDKNTTASAISSGLANSFVGIDFPIPLAQPVITIVLFLNIWVISFSNLINSILGHGSSIHI